MAKSAAQLLYGPVLVDFDIVYRSKFRLSEFVNIESRISIEKFDAIDYSVKTNSVQQYELRGNSICGRIFLFLLL